MSKNSNKNYGWDKRRVMMAAIAGGMAVLMLIQVVMMAIV